MESEKVKEIKKALQQTLEYCARELERKLFQDCLTLINELESENETFLESKTMWKRLHTELCKENQQLKAENEKLKQHKQELQGGQQDLAKTIKAQHEKIANLENIGLNENITVAELEKENKRLDKVVKHNHELIEDGKLISSEQLKQFAERLKEKLYNYRIWGLPYEEWCKGNVVCGEIDDTLKEFINETT